MVIGDPTSFVWLATFQVESLAALRRFRNRRDTSFSSQQNGFRVALLIKRTTGSCVSLFWKCCLDPTSWQWCYDIAIIIAQQQQQQHQYQVNPFIILLLQSRRANWTRKKATGIQVVRLTSCEEWYYPNWGIKLWRSWSLQVRQVWKIGPIFCSSWSFQFPCCLLTIAFLFFWDSWQTDWCFFGSFFLFSGSSSF